MNKDYRKIISMFEESSFIIGELERLLKLLNNAKLNDDDLEFNNHLELAFEIAEDHKERLSEIIMKLLYNNMDNLMDDVKNYKL